MRKYIILVLLTAGTYLGLKAQVSPAKVGVTEGKKFIPQYLDDISRQTTAEGTKLAYIEFVKALPEQHNLSASVLFDLAKKDVAFKLIKYDDPSALEYAAQIKDVAIRHQAYEIMPQKWLNKKNVAKAEAILKMKIAESKAQMTTNKHQESAFYAYNGAYAQLLYTAGAYKQALNFTRAIEGKVFLKGSDPEIYALIMQKNGDHATAFPVLEQIVKRGVASKTVKETLERSWLALGKDSKAFPAHLESLYDTIRVNKAAAMEGKMINYAAPQFSLSNLKGEIISLESLKGKVVFIDFWATWCGPCVRSFPAMQKAVNKYKDNPDVVFLFINSLEKNADLEKRGGEVATFLAKKDFQFEVLLDVLNAGKYDVVNKFKVSGIPAKFVIDKAGNVRYALTGFDGGTDAAAEEVGVLIENTLKM